MTGRQKELQLLLTHLKDKKVSVNKKLKGTVTGYTGSYLLLKDVEHWNGNKQQEAMLNSKWIENIELIN